MSLPGNEDGTATLSGTPAAGSGGTYTLSITASNGVEPEATQTFTLTVDQAPDHHQRQRHHLHRGQRGDVLGHHHRLPHPPLHESGSLPGGVTFLDNGNGTATLSGTPTSGSGGTYTLSITASNGVDPEATQTFTFTVDQAPAITSDNDTTFTVGSAGTFSVTTTGFPNASLERDRRPARRRQFPRQRNGTATLSGMPAAGSAGVYTLMLTADNGVAPDASQDFTTHRHVREQRDNGPISPSTTVYGQLLTISAHVSTGASGIVPTGTVTFRAGNTVLDRATLDASGNATFSTSTLAVGPYMITASYGGDANLSSSTSTPMALTVNPAPTAVTAQPSTSVTTVGQPITLTATITTPPGTGTPTGTVTFMDGTTVLGTAPVYPAGSVSPTVSSPTGGSKRLPRPNRPASPGRRP